MNYDVTCYLSFLLQAYNAGLNFANVNEARNFVNEIEKKLQEKLQRRQGEESQLKIDLYVRCTVNPSLHVYRTWLVNYINTATSLLNSHFILA